MGMRNIVASSHHTLTALLWTNGELLEAPIFDIPDVVDPVGVGDAFMAGYLHALYADDLPKDDQVALEYSLAAATLKNTINGDFNLASDEEVRALL
jgi:2-dehydro-3-deoxygluconokinase